MFKHHKSFRLLTAVLTAAIVLTAPSPAFAASGKPQGATYTAVQLQAVGTKEMAYYKTGDASIPNDIEWTTEASALDFLPGEATGDVTCAVKDGDGTYWIGTENGLQRVNFKEADSRDIVQYFAGPRYLYGGDDYVTGVAGDGAGGVWVKTESGVTHISMPVKTMQEKAKVYEDIVSSVNDRRGMVAESAFTFSDSAKSYADYSSDTGSFVGYPATTDNDGLWTAMNAIGEIFHYRTLRDDYGANPTASQKAEIEKARDAAVRSTKAVLLLDYISGRGNGFPCRSYMLTSEDGAQTTDGTDYGFQNTNGLWFHEVPGETNPNGIIPDMQLPGKTPIGYSIVRITKDAQTKWGSKLFPGSDPNDPMSYNGVQLSNDAIAALNDSRTAGEKLGTDVYTVRNDTHFVMPVITSNSNQKNGTSDTSTSDSNRPVFQLTVPIYEKIPTIFNDLFPASAIGSDGHIDQSQIVYKADTSSDEVDGHYALFFTAYTYLCDDSTSELQELKPLIAEATDRMTKLILNDDHYYIEDATGKSTQWSRWLAKYFNDSLAVMKEQPLWKENVGVDENGDDALSYGYEDGPLNALEVMSALKTAMSVTAEDYPQDQALFSAAYDLTYDSEGYSVEEPFVNGKGYIDMALDYIDRRVVRQATNAYDINNNNVASTDAYDGDMEDDSNTNATLHNDWTQYINYSDEELGWFPVYELILQEKDPERLAQIVSAYDQWYSNEVREENPFYTFLYQIAHPTDKTVDLQSAVRYLYRMPQYRVKFDAQNERQDVFYIEPGDRDDAAQTNYALPLDETLVHKDNTNPFEVSEGYSKKAGYEYKSGSMDSGTVFTLPYWLGRYFGIIEEEQQ
ncbi:MAG TPA: hypothetical protein PKA19_02870 [Bacillota bacterium]|nr:hypothetical protein [Bacillota bacterium]